MPPGLRTDESRRAGKRPGRQQSRAGAKELKGTRAHRRSHFRKEQEAGRIFWERAWESQVKGHASLLDRPRYSVRTSENWPLTRPGQLVTYKGQLCTRTGLCNVSPNNQAALVRRLPISGRQIPKGSIPCRRLSSLSSYHGLHCDSDRRHCTRKASPPSLTAYIPFIYLLSRSTRDAVAARIKTIQQSSPRFQPQLAIIQAGERPDSVTYVRMKAKAAEEVGITFKHIALPAAATVDQIIDRVKHLNDDDSVSGILVQLPLGDHVDAEGERLVTEAVSPEKDVDGSVVHSPLCLLSNTCSDSMPTILVISRLAPPSRCLLRAPPPPSSVFLNLLVSPSLAQMQLS